MIMAGLITAWRPRVSPKRFDSRLLGNHLDTQVFFLHTEGPWTANDITILSKPGLQTTD